MHGQIEALQVNYGAEGKSGKGVTIDHMNHRFSAREVDELSDLLSMNLDAALELITRIEVEGKKTTLGP